MLLYCNDTTMYMFLFIIGIRKEIMNEKKLAELTKAKEAVTWLLKHDGLVDMHGIVYWSGVVERLRGEIKGGL